MVIETKPYVVYSAVFGDYDDVVTPQVIFDDVDYVLFTDQDIKSDHWRIVNVDWFGTIDDEYGNRRPARHFKAIPGLYMPYADIIIWIDMTHEVHKHPAEIADNYLVNSDIALFRHELRDCVYAEASAVKQYRMDTADNLDRQTHFYQTQKYPMHHNLWETPGVVRRNTTDMIQMGMMWWEMMCKYSSRDQISLPFVLNKLKIKPTVLPGFAGKCSEINNKVIPKIRAHKPHQKLVRDRKKMAGYFSDIMSGYSIPINSIKVVR